MEEQKMQTNDLQKTKIFGKMTFNFSQQEAFDVGDVEGHIVSLRKAEGTNINVGKIRIPLNHLQCGMGRRILE